MDMDVVAPEQQQYTQRPAGVWTERGPTMTTGGFFPTKSSNVSSGDGYSGGATATRSYDLKTRREEMQSERSNGRDPSVSMESLEESAVPAVGSPDHSGKPFALTVANNTIALVKRVLQPSDEIIEISKFSCLPIYLRWTAPALIAACMRNCRCGTEQCHRLSTKLRHVAFMDGIVRGQTHQMTRVLTAVRVAKANSNTRRKQPRRKVSNRGSHQRRCQQD